MREGEFTAFPAPPVGPIRRRRPCLLPPTPVPDLTTTARQLLLYGHLLAFAFAFVAVVREDIAMCRATRIDPRQLRRTAHQVLILLVVLWVSGVGMLALEGNLDPATWGLQPKLAAKVTVVCLLTLNGLLLHRLAFPLMTQRQRLPGLAATICVILGAFSAVGWSYAAFLGVARVIAPAMSYGDFLAILGLALVPALGLALVVVRPRLQRLIRRSDAGRREALAQAVEVALRKTFGASSSLILDPATRRRHGHDPVVYARALAERIPARAQAGRERFLRRIEPLLGAPLREFEN